MAKTLIFKRIILFVALTFCMLFIATTASAQNILVDGNFESYAIYGQITNPSYTDYTRKNGPYVVEAGEYVINNTTSGHGGGQGWPMPSDSHGKFMIVNGFGGSANASKVVWRQTVSVTTQTTYTLSYRVVNLNRTIYGQIYPSKIQVKVNGNNLGEAYQLPTNNNWQTRTLTWNSGTNVQATIEFYDVSTSNSGMGDDFCLDDLSFVPDVMYSVDAIDDTGISVCKNVSHNIDVMANDIISPNTNGVVVSVVTPPSYGTFSYVNGNMVIRYTYSGGSPNGTDQFKYRVATHGIYDEAWVYINTNQEPEVANITAPGTICAGSPLGIPTPSVTPNVTGHWERCQTQNGNWTQFDPNSIPMSMNNFYVRYTASNSCGDGSSNAVQIQVSDEPTIGTPPSPTAICAGGNFSLTTPSIQNNNSAIISQGWQISPTQNGTYNTFNNNNIPYTYNGYWIRYFAENDCGLTYSPSVQITVNDTPIVGAITAPAAICAGQSFNLTAPSVTWRHTNQGTGSWEIQINGTWQALTNSNIPFSYNGCIIRYKAVNGCGTAYSSNTVQVTVYSTEPTYEEITACDTYIWNGVTCDHTGDYQAQVQNANGCTITAHLHFIMSDAYTETQSFTECESFTWPVNGQTYHTSGTDTYTVVSSNPLICDSIYTLNLVINNAPTISGNLQDPSDICMGDLLAVAEPQYQMNHNGGGRTRWDYATSENGPFHPFDPTTYHLDYGSYYVRFAVINGCDSTFSNVVQVNVNDQPVVSGQLDALQVCEGNPLELPQVSVQWKNQDVNDRFAEWQMSSAQNGNYAGFNPSMPMQSSQNGYWIRYVARNSCGEDVLGPVRITVLSADDVWLETITACDSYELPSGQIIFESQVIEYEEELPCFHIIHQPIEIHTSDYFVERITSCHDDYVWHGMTFHRSDEMQYAWDTLTNQANCDSVVELQLDFGPYSTFIHNRVACDSYEWEMKPGVVYYETQLDSVFVPAVDIEDCDTWYYLDLIVGHDTMVEGAPMTGCSGFEWHGVPYYSDAIVYDSLQTSITHCDSIVLHQLTILQPYHTEFDMMQCQPIWWQEHYCDHVGDYEHTFSSIQGCDSLVTMHFSLSDEIQVTEEHFACEPFPWYEHYCDQDGHQYAHTFSTAQGCDSTVILTLHLTETQVITEPVIYACDSYTFNGVVYDYGVHEVYHDTLLSASGDCDSIVHFTRIEVKNAAQMGQISGSANVYVASNLINGIYRYDIDTAGVIGDVTWTISNPNWSVVESQANYCRVLVPVPGSGVLSARFQTSICGEMEKQFEINAGFFGIEEHKVDVEIYPNPTNGVVNVVAESIESIRIVDMMGQTLGWHEYDHADNANLHFGGLKPSVYLLEIKTANGMARRRVVLQR